MADDQDYERAVEKGTRLLQLMLANDTKAGQLLDPPQQSVQSAFTSVEDLAAHGYTGQRGTSCVLSGREVIRRLSTALQALGVDADMARDGGKNFVVEHKHSEDRILDGVEYPVSIRMQALSTDELIMNRPPMPTSHRFATTPAAS